MESLESDTDEKRAKLSKKYIKTHENKILMRFNCYLRVLNLALIYDKRLKRKGMPREGEWFLV